MDISNYSRIIGLYIASHIICLIIEAYRIKNSYWNFKHFIKYEMLLITYLLLTLDLAIGILMILLWAFQPLIHI